MFFMPFVYLPTIEVLTHRVAIPQRLGIRLPSPERHGGPRQGRLGGLADPVKIFIQPDSTFDSEPMVNVSVNVVGMRRR